MRIRSGLLLVLWVELLLAGCAATPQHFPSATATRYVGKPLLELEMHWSTPWDLSAAADGKVAKWHFDQYNLAGCNVTVHTDAAGIIRHVTWTRGCGPKGTGTSTGRPWDQPYN
jgi:hypothetical protein